MLPTLMSISIMLSLIFILFLSNISSIRTVQTSRDVGLMLHSCAGTGSGGV